TQSAVGVRESPSPSLCEPPGEGSNCGSSSSSWASGTNIRTGHWLNEFTLYVSGMIYSFSIYIFDLLNQCDTTNRKPAATVCICRSGHTLTVMHM
uniref:Uncharacterized protein n=1 Tax=Neolamprologus brichardi TaxID=32507 RepID=A0A3Q4NB00_NEOBR